MNLGDIIGKGLTGLVAPVADYLKARQEIRSKERVRKAELADAIHERTTSLIREGLAADATWEIEQIKNSGWKDEYVLMLLSIPMIGCFIPGMDVYILRGFNVLDGTPDWYQWLIVTIFGAIYGIRLWRRNQSDT